MCEPNNVKLSSGAEGLQHDLSKTEFWLHLLSCLPMSSPSILSASHVFIHTWDTFCFRDARWGTGPAKMQTTRSSLKDLLLRGGSYPHFIKLQYNMLLWTKRFSGLGDIIKEMSSYWGLKDKQDATYLSLSQKRKLGN